MSSVVKDNQVLASIPDAKSSSSAGSTGASGDTSPRPQPVALEVAVTVNGARTVAGSDKREPFSESTKTVLIFGNGAVVRLVSTVAPGQLLFLTNEKTKKEVVCQVVKSRNYSNASGYVELEFTEPVAGFWGMRFPAAASPSHTATPAQSTNAGTPKSSPGTPSASAKPAAPPTGSATSPETKSVGSSSPHPTVTAPAAPFSSIPAPSSQSSSHPIHSYTSSAPAVSGGSRPSNVLDISKSKAAKSEAASAKNSAAPSKSILDSDEVKIPSWLEPLARNAAAASAAQPELTAKEQLHHQDAVEVDDLSLTEISDTPEVAAHPVAAPTFGTHFFTEEHVISSSGATGGSSKKILIGAIAAGILLAAGGGAWYVRQQNKNSAPVNTAATVNGSVDAGSNAQSQPQTQVPSSPSGNYTAVSSPTGTGAGVSAGLTASKPVDASPVASNANKKLATVDSPLAAAVAQPKKPKLGEVNLSAPVVNKPAAGRDRSEEALNLGSSGTVGGGEALSSGLVANSKQPVAPPAPLPVGGDVKAARLISSVPPQYPSIARSQRVGGDVKIDALVDINGQVAGMKIISGPVLLQQPAMDALRHWKYESAQLNGKAVPMHLTVTVQFKLQ
jgi:TonB family protein